MASIPDSPLDAAFRELADLIADFQQARYGSGENALQRIVSLLDGEPLAGFIRERLPKVDYEAWLNSIGAAPEHSSRRALKWSTRRAENAATIIELVRDLSTSEQHILMFTRDFTNAGHGDITTNYRRFGDVILFRMHRDLERLAENRDLPLLLAPLVGRFPESGDPTLDKLLAEAVARFQDRDPQNQATGIERLWDAFERMKTLNDGVDKKASAEALLQSSVQSGEVRDAIRTEMLALTKIGNEFGIRHFERGTYRLQNGAERDYLFYRLFALMSLLLRPSRKP